MSNNLKTYSIPIEWQSCKIYKVEAENLQEAVTKALGEFLAMPDDNYLQDSYSITEYDILGDNSDLEEESFDIHKAVLNIKFDA